MNKVTSYLKNVGKSAAYASIDVASNFVPEVKDFIETNNDVFKATYAATANGKKSIKMSSDMIQNSPVYKDIRKGIKNVFDDIKTGNFYNKERAQQSIDAVADAWTGANEDFGFDDFDLDGFDDDFDDDTEEEKPRIAPATKGDAMVADAVSKSGNFSAQLISKTVANTSKAIIDGNIAGISALMSQNANLMAGVRTSIAGIHESINSLLKATTEASQLKINNDSKFYEESTSLLRENNSILKEMLDIQKNMYKKQEASESYDQSRNVFSGGVLDIKEYSKVIKKNLLALDPTGSLESMTSDVGDGTTMLGQMFSNPLGAITTGLIKSFIPKDTAKALTNFGKTLGSFFPAMIARLNRAKRNDEGGIFGILGKIFGIKTDNKKDIDTSKYNKGAVPFDGITRKAIVDVIPEHLSKIESLLSGQSQRIYDFDTGKWVNAKDIKKRQEKEYNSNIKDSFSEVDTYINAYKRELEDMKAVTREQMKSFSDDIFEMMKNVYENEEGWFSPKDVLKNQNYFKESELMEGLLKFLDQKTPGHVISSVASRTMENKNYYGNKMRESEISGTNLIRKLSDNSNNDSHLRYDKEFDNIVTGNNAPNSILNIRDKSGSNMLDYLRSIATNTEYIRINGVVSNFEKFEKDFKVGDGGIPQELIDKRKNKQDVYAKSRKETYDIESEDAAYAALVRLQNKSIDEDYLDEYGSRRKERGSKNKWQLSMDEIPGDTFTKKLSNANSMKEKYAVIMGSLSDLAKKPGAVLTGLVEKADRSIYNFLFKARTDEFDDDNKKIDGMFNLMIYKMKQSFTDLTDELKNKLIQPLAERLGLGEKWDKVKDKVKNSSIGQRVGRFANDVKEKIHDNANALFGYTKDSMYEVTNPIRYSDHFSEGAINRRTTKIKNLNKNIDAALAPEYFISGQMKKDLQAMSRKDKSKLSYATIKRLTDEKGKAEAGQAAKEAKRNEALVKARNSYDKNTKSPLAEIAKIVGSNPDIETHAGPGDHEPTGEPKITISSGNEKVTVKDTGKPKAGEKIVNMAQEQRVLKDINEINSAINKEQKLKKQVEDIKKNKGHNNVDWAIDSTKEEILKVGNYVKEKVNDVLGTSDKKNKKKDESKLRKTVGSVVREMGGHGADTVAKSIIGGGLGLLSGVVGGPLIGAAIGSGYSIIKNSNTVQKYLFGTDSGKKDKDGNVIMEGGVFSDKIQKTYKKYIPDMGKYGVAGAISSLILPFGPLAGAAIGAGISFTKNSKTMNEMIFGTVETDKKTGETHRKGGLISEERIKTIKKYFPKASTGAIAGLFLGPFGMMGNAALGAGIGMLTGTDEFQDLILGKKGSNGERFGGIKGTLDEHFVQPLKDFGKNFKDDFFGFIKESMIDPLNEAITPITSEIGYAVKKVVFGIPKKFAKFGKDYIADPFMEKLNGYVVKPLARLNQKLFGGLFRKIKGAISLPFRAVGRLGRHVRKRQVRNGRDVVSDSAKERLQFADANNMGNYKYRGVDEYLNTISDERNENREEDLQEVVARAGMLAHGADYFEKEVKKTGKQLSKVMIKYKEIGWLVKGKGTWKKIEKAIKNNDVEKAIELLTSVRNEKMSGMSNKDPNRTKAEDAVDEFTSANEKYQAAKKAREGFNKNISSEENQKWMEERFGKNWKDLDAEKIYNYAAKELNTTTGKKVTKEDIFDPKLTETKGEKIINNTLTNIYELIEKLNANMFPDSKDAKAYKRKAAAAKEKGLKKRSEEKSNIINNLSKKSKVGDVDFEDNTDEVSDILYSDPKMLKLVTVCFTKGNGIKGEDIIKLSKMKLNKKQYKKLQDFPYLVGMPKDTIKKFINMNRNNHASIVNNSGIMQKNLQQLEDAIKAGIDPSEIDISMAEMLTEGGYNDKYDHMKRIEKYKAMNKRGLVGDENFQMAKKDILSVKNGASYDEINKTLFQTDSKGRPIKYVKDKSGDWQMDDTDADTKGTLKKQEEEDKEQKGFFSSIKNIKTGLFGWFKRNSDKDKEEKKEPWYKKLFNTVLGGGSGIASKLKFGAAILGGFTLIGKIKNMWDDESDNGVMHKVASKIGGVINPVTTKLHDWFTNEGDYSDENKGLSGFLTNHFFPNMFTGINIIFEKVLPVVLKSFIVSLPSLIKAGVSGIAELLRWNKRSKNKNQNKFSKTSVKSSSSGKSITSNIAGSGWLDKVRDQANDVSKSIESVKVNESGNAYIDDSNKDTNSSTSNTTNTSTTDNSSTTTNNTYTTINNDQSPATIGDMNMTMYKKDKNGKLVPITSAEYSQNGADGFYTETGAHYTYNSQTGEYESDKGDTYTEGPGLIRRVGGAGLKAALTGRTMGIARMGRGLMNTFGIGKVMSAGGKALGKTTSGKLVKGAGKGFAGITDLGKTAGEKTRSITGLLQDYALEGKFTEGVSDLVTEKKNGLLEKVTGKLAGKENKGAMGLLHDYASEGKFGEGVKDLLSEKVGKKAAEKATTEVAEGAAKKGLGKRILEKTKDVTSGAKDKVLEFVKGMLNKIFNNSFTKKIMGKILGDKGGEKAITKICKTIINKLTTSFARMASKLGESKMGQILAKIGAGSATAGLMTVAFIVKDLTWGFDQAESILGITEPTTLQRFIAALVNTITNEVFFGIVDSSTVVDWVVDIILPLFNVDVSDFQKQREEADKEVEEWNAKNGENLSKEEYLNKDKLTYKISNGISAAKEWAGDKVSKGIGWVKDKGGKALGKVGDAVGWVADKGGKALSTVGKFAGTAYDQVSSAVGATFKTVGNGIADGWDLTKYALKIAGNIVKRAWTGEKGDTDDTIDKKDKLADAKYTIYKLTKLTMAIPAALVKLVKVTKDTIGGAVDGFIKVGAGVLNTGKDLFEKSWNGKIVDVLNDNSYDVKSGNQLADNSSILLNTITKTVLAVPGLITASVGFVVRNIGDIVNGVKAIGSGMGNTVSDLFTRSWNGEFIDVLSDNSMDANTGNGFVDGTSKVLNSIIKTALFVPAGVTAAAGFAVDELQGVIDGVVSIGSSVGTMVSNVMTTATEGENPMDQIFSGEDDANTGNGFVDTASKMINSIIKVPLTPIALVTTGVSWVVKKISGFFDTIKDVATLSSADSQLIEDAYTGKVNPFSGEYWKVNTNGNLTGIASGLYSFNSYMQKVLNMPAALLAMINPIKWVQKGVGWLKEKAGDLWQGAKDVANDGWTWVKEAVGIEDKDKVVVDKDDKSKKDSKKSDKSDKSDKSGKGSGFISQLDPKYKSQKFNIPGDTQIQTIGDSGCAPATAANILNIYAGRGGLENAANAALKYKDRDGGVTPNYFTDYLGKNGISTYATTNKQQMLDGISSGNPTVLLGADPTNKANTPYGSRSSHYVVATGMDGKGNVIVQDPESKRPNSLYPAKDLLSQSSYGMVTGRGSGKDTKNGFISFIKKYGFGRGSNTVNQDLATFSDVTAEELNAAISKLTGGKQRGFTGKGQYFIDASKASGLDPRYILAHAAIESAWGDSKYAKAGNFFGIGAFDSNPDNALKYKNDSMALGLTNGATWIRKNYYDRGQKTLYQMRYNNGSHEYCTSNTWANDIAKIMDKLPANTNATYHDADANYVAGSSDGSSSDSSSSSNSLFSFLETIPEQVFGKDLMQLMGFSTSSSDSSSSSSSSDGSSGSTEGLGDLSNVSELRKNIVTTANSYVGKIKYSQARRNDINTGGGYADCSSFTQHVLKKVTGQDIGSTTRTIRPNGHTISQSEALPGDLAYTNGGGHIGIYAGNGQWIACNGGSPDKNAGPGVQLKNISSKAEYFRPYILDGKGSGKNKNLFSAKEQKSILAVADKYKNNNKKVVMYDENGRKTNKLTDDVTYFSGSGSLPSLDTSSSLSGSTYISTTTSNTNTDRLLSAIIDILKIIANNSEKLSEVVSLLSRALDVNLTNDDISNLQSSNAQIKNKIANALKAQGSSTGMGNSVMGASTQSLADAMYTIARS